MGKNDYADASKTTSARSSARFPRTSQEKVVAETILPKDITTLEEDISKPTNTHTLLGTFIAQSYQNNP